MKPKKQQKPRNYLLACVAHNDPGRYRDRAVEGEVRKSLHNRAKAKRDWQREASSSI